MTYQDAGGAAVSSVKASEAESSCARRFSQRPTSQTRSGGQAGERTDWRDRKYEQPGRPRHGLVAECGRCEMAMTYQRDLGCWMARGDEFGGLRGKSRRSMEQDLSLSAPRPQTAKTQELRLCRRGLPATRSPAPQHTNSA